MVRRHSAVAALALSAGLAWSQTTWINAAGGNWNTPANWDTGVVPNSAAVAAVLPDILDPYTVFGNLSATVFSCTIDPDVTLAINAGVTFSFAGGGLLNNGLIVVNTSGTFSNVTLRSIDTAAILGVGRIELNTGTDDLLDANISGALAPLTIGAGQTIAGSGTLTGPITLLGTIDADRAGRDLNLTGAIDASGGGIIGGSNDGTATITGTITGGTLSGNVYAVGGSATINGSESFGVNGVRAGATLNLLDNGLLNEGTWIVNSNGTFTNALLRSIVPATISGGGNIELNAMTTDLFDAQIAGMAGAPLEIGIGQTVNGSGLVQGPITLTGTIDADRAGRDILVRGDITGVGFGNMRGSNGGKVAFEGNLAGGHMAGGVEAQAGTGSVDGVASVGANGVRPGSTFSIRSGGLVNDGTWVVNTAGTFSNALMRSTMPAVISGGGHVELNAMTADLFDAQIAGSEGAPLTFGADQKVTGSGVVQGPIVLLGTIEADRDARDVETRGAIDATGGGVLRGIDGGKVATWGTTLTGGTIAGGVEATSSATTYNGTTATGVNGVRPSSTLGIVGNGLINHGTIVVNTAGSFSDAAIAATAEPATISGQGNIELNSITSDLGDAQIRGSVGAPLTIGSDQAITGSGLVRGPMVIHGTVHANRSGRDLRLLGVAGGSFEASAGGRLIGTDGGFTTLSGVTLIGGQWLGGVHVEAGTSIVSDLVMSGINGLRPGAVMTIASSSITNNGTLVVNTAGSFSDAVINASIDTSIHGSGTVLLAAATSDLGDARFTPAGVTITTGVDQTIAGRGLISGPMRILGTMAPGSDAAPTQEIRFSVAPQLADSSRFEFQIAGANAVDYDRITGAAPWAFDGTFAIELLEGYLPPFNTRFTLVTGSGMTGQPHTVETPQIGLGVFRLVFSPTKVEAVWTCEADLNGDGNLDFFDVQAFLNAFSQQALYGDYNGDGLVNFFDVQAFLNDFSAGCL